MRLEGKKIVVIGGTSGMGLSAARVFVEAGAKVLVTGHLEEDVKLAEKSLGNQGVACLSDAREESSAQEAIDTCIRHFGDFDGLYHVAGGSGRRMGDGPLHELSLEGWNYTINLNLTSLMLSNRAAIRSFLSRKKAGTILNMGSVLAFSPAPDYFATHAYTAAKAAIVGFSKSIAAYYAPNNIRINVLAPGLVETPMSQRAVNDDTIVAFVKNKQALDGGRVGKPNDLDGLALYFMSDLSKFTTGQVVGVDGGWGLR
jgi:NAD(P)-dependent dehydrogenase (short-subunit alcohol dehydrogenase family)